MTKAVSQAAEAVTVATEAPGKTTEHRFQLADYAVLLKPRVMSLVVFTAFVGLVVAPGTIEGWRGLVAVLSIALGAGASGAINMWYDRDIDAWMARTRNRPLPAGRLEPRAALIFGSVLSASSVVCMATLVNAAAAALLAVTILYYVFIYTVWLKRRTPQNIVIGGAAGAFPPMIGWAAVTGGIDAGSMALFAIIFLWTPPHSWALALFRRGDYEAAGVPMLPVVAGARATKRQMLMYTALLMPASLAPMVFGHAGWAYGAAAVALGAGFVFHAVRVWRDPGEAEATAKSMFLFSILYLFLLFAAMLFDTALQSLA
jgi:protoheme IX farnesyltransferase